MKNKLFLKQSILSPVLSVLCCLSFTACDQQNDAERTSGLNNSDEPLQLSAEVTGLTRASDAGFETGDSLGVFVVKWKSDTEQDSLHYAGNYAGNICFCLDKFPNDWIADHITYYPNDDRMIDLYAYYPYRTPVFGAGTVIHLTVAANQASYRNYTLSDFMVAQTDTVSRSPFKVPLVFDHKLSQMVFELKPGAGFTTNDLVNAKVKVVNAIIDATFDLASIKGGNPVAGTTRADITPCGTWTENGGLLTGMKAIVVPQPINAITYIQVAIGNRTFTYRPAEDKNMNIGCSRKFVITINNTGLDITTAVHPWDNCPLVEGDAKEEFYSIYMQEFVPNPTDSVGTELTLIDKRDHRSYRVVKCADNRWWLGENLKFHYTTGTFCRTYQDNPAYLEKYGYMYDYYTAKKSIPDNWHLPTDAEFTALEIALGMSPDDAAKYGEWRNSGNVGTKLKAGGSAKMNMEMSGYCSYGLGIFEYLDAFGMYLSDTEYNSDALLNRDFDNGLSGVSRHNCNKKTGGSVRCVLNQ